MLNSFLLPIAFPSVPELVAAMFRDQPFHLLTEKELSNA